MSSLGGPSIVTSGLVLHLDAANIKSFRGEPTVNLALGPLNITGNYGTTTGFINGAGTTLSIGTLLNFTGEYNAGTITASTASWVAYIYPISGATVSSQFTTTWYLKAGSAYSIDLNWGGNHNGNRTNFTVNLLTGFVTNITIASGETYSVTQSTNGFYKISYSSTLQTGTLYYPQVSPAIGSIIFGGIQIEAKSYATTFVNGTRGTTVETGGGWIDRSGNSNSGQIINGPTYNSLKGGSISFDGVNDYVTVPSLANTAFPQDTGTIAIWYNIDSTGATSSLPPIFDGYEARNHIFIRRSSNPSISIQIALQDLLNVSYKYVYDHTNLLTLDAWHNIVITYITGVSSSVKVYVDGLLVNTGTISDSTWRPTGQFVGFGASNATNTAKGKGGIIQVYNKALSVTEVLQNYNATKSRFI